MSLKLRKILASVFAVSALAAVSVGGISQAVAHPSHAAHHKKHHKKHKSRIPQHNGGDHDSDNNGGPSDGDGNI